MGNAKARGSYADRKSNPLGSQGNHTRPHAGRRYKVYRAKTRVEINAVVSEREAALTRRRAGNVVKTFQSMIEAGTELTPQEQQLYAAAQNVLTPKEEVTNAKDNHR